MRLPTTPLLAALFLAAGHSAAAQGYSQTNLVTDNQAVAQAQITDPNLKNPWGIAFSPTGAFWISDNGTGVSTLYSGDSNGAALKTVPLVVTIPGVPTGAQGSPTGQVFNGNSSLFGGAAFITSSEDGTLAAWKGAFGSTAQLAVTTPGAVYKGLAIAGSSLYAANFSQNTISVFDSSFAPATLAGSFTDPNAVAGYAPFNVQNLGGNLFVTYAQQDAAKFNEVDGTGLGYVDEFNLDGTFNKRIGTGSALTAGGTDALNAPWGLALAPSSFGQFGGDLLVGNFGSGQISAFDPASGAFQGVVSDALGKPLVNDGLWGLTFGNGGGGGSKGTLYFAAGINGEQDGLFGSIAPAAVPEASTTISFGALLALGGLVFVARRKKAGVAA